MSNYAVPILRVVASTILPWAMLAACSSTSSPQRGEAPRDEPEPPPAATDTADRNASDDTEHEPDPAPSPPFVQPRAHAVQQAEMFVRNQGYTAVAPLFEAPLVREALDDSDESAVRSARRGTLRPRSVGARVEGDGWLVFFAYASNRASANAGRAVRVRRSPAGDAWHAEMVHQDAVLPAPPTRLELIGRFRALSGPAAHCGHMHFVAVAHYDVVRVVSGRYEESEVMVIHGCPELPRTTYTAGAGSLERFDVGALHRLVLVPDIPEVTGGVAIIDENERPDLHRYWAERTDLAASDP
jgi:hypothetical protein